MNGYRYFLNGIFKTDTGVYRISIPAPYLQENKEDAISKNKNMTCRFLFYETFGDISIAVYASDKKYLLEKEQNRYCFKETINDPVYHYDSDLFFKSQGIIEKLNDGPDVKAFTREDFQQCKKIIPFREILKESDMPIQIQKISFNIENIF